MDDKGLADAPKALFHGDNNAWMQIFSDCDLDTYFPDYHQDPEIIGDEIEEMLENF